MSNESKKVKGPAVSRETLLHVLHQVQGIFDHERKVVPPANVVWQIVSSLLDFQMTPKYIWVCMNENRWNVQSDLRLSLGVPKPDIPAVSSDSELEDGDEAEYDTGSEDSKDKVRPKKTFSVTISPDIWEDIKPTEATYRRSDRPQMKRNVLILPQHKWTHVVSSLLWEQHKLPCAYSFKRGSVAQDYELREQYVKMSASCHECGAEAEGNIINEPIDRENVHLEWRAPDTRKVLHKSKRYCSGAVRQRVGKEVEHQSASVYRRHQADLLMDESDLTEPPHLYNTTVLRKVKQQSKDKKLDIPPDLGVFEALQHMKYSAPYSGSIQFIAIDPVVIHYSTPGQLAVYKTFRKSSYTKLTVDATGGLCRRIDRLNGLSGHIFLFEFVLHTGEQQIPVLQCLTEKQDASNIIYWIHEWLRRGASIPHEVVCDKSKALLSALARTFGQSKDLQEYKEVVFQALLSSSSAELPPCFIRRDVAHLFSNASKWDAWKHKGHRIVKDHYMRWLGLLVQATTIREFAETLKHILTMAYCETCNKDVEESKEFLLSRISGLPYEPPNHDNSSQELDECDEEPSEPDQDTPDSVKSWLQVIDMDARKHTADEGVEPNPYHSLLVAKKFLDEAQDFMLWCGVLIDRYNSPNARATSASVEGDFADLKNRILKNEWKPLQIHKMVAHHLKSITGQTKIAAVSVCSNIKTKNPEHQLVSTTIQCAEQDRITAPDHDSAAKVTQDMDPPKNKVRKVSKVTEKDKEETPKLEIKSEPDNESLNADDQVPLTDCQDQAPHDLNTVENWRGLAKPKAGNKRKSKYMTPKPDIHLAQPPTFKIPKRRLLHNGDCSSIMLEPGTSVIVRNTCCFDSFTQLLAVAVGTYPSFRATFQAALDATHNTTLQAAWYLASKGVDKEAYKLRAQAMVPHCILSSAADIPTGRATRNQRIQKTSAVLTYDGWANVCNFINKLMGNDFPSLSVTKECHQKGCPHPTVEVFHQPLLSVNSNTFLRLGMQGLQAAIMQNAHSKPQNCTNLSCGSQTVVELCTPGDILIVDVDFIGTENLGVTGGINDTSQTNRQYKLEEIPQEIHLHSSSYTLVGVIGYRPGHYMGYARQPFKGTWELYDGLARDIQVVGDKTEVLPHCLLYVCT